MTRYLLLSLALGLALLAAACGAPAAQPAPSQPSSPPAAPPTSQPTAAPRPTSVPAPAPTPTPQQAAPAGATPIARTGTVDVRVTDAPPKDVTRILVTASKIEAQVTGANGESGWRTILEKPPVFDLVALTGIEGSLGTSLLPEGKYQQVRLSVDKVVVTVAGVDREAEVPSDKLRVVGGFDVAAGKTTVVTLDFDAEKSVVLAGPKVQVKPVVKLLVQQPAERPEPAKRPLTRAAASPAAPSLPATSSAQATSAARVQLSLVQGKSEARFLSRETVANLPLPRDAIGVTKKVTGELTLGGDGGVVKGQSKFVVDMESLQTDNANRDRYIKANTLEVSKYPTSEFVVAEVKGLSLPLPTSGVLKFQLIGEMTLHGVTKPVTWDVLAQANEKGMTGRASASVKFVDFNMTKPLTAVILSIEDTVRLEVDFTADRSQTPAASAPTQTQPGPAATGPTGPSASGAARATPAATAPALQEYAVPPGSGPHDVAPAADGGVWYTAQRTGELGWLDPATGRTRHVKLGAGSSPHGVIVGPDGAPWITDGGLNAIVRVDPRTNGVKVFPLPAGSAYANMNTATFDRRGVLWFTGQSGVYGRLDPATGKVDVYNAPRGRGPYGIATAPDGTVYYASLAGNYIARVDLGSGAAAVLEPPTPGQGARRVWADSRGRAWVSEWNSGQVSVHDPATGAWRAWKLPGEGPRPYAVYVDERDMVWLSDFTANTIVRFDPARETFQSFPLPSYPANVRQILGRPGEVWAAASGVDKLVVVRTSAS